VLDLRSQISLNTESPVPIYKQLADSFTSLIEKGKLPIGEKLPPTRELAGLLGLNRTTVSAAYALLESLGLIEGHVGRGSFVAGRFRRQEARPSRWESTLPPLDEPAPAGHDITVSFASSRPPETAFPLTEFRRVAQNVLESPEAADILQLGSSYGYGPLRQYLLEEAISEHVAGPGDDLMITNGCQQALDLLARLFVAGGKTTAVEDPVYHGLLRVFSRAGAEILPVPVDEDGLNVDVLEENIQHRRPRLLVITPSFQNPTGLTLSLRRRERLIELAQRFDLLLIENDIYSALRYRGKPLPTLKVLDPNGNTILLRSYSKVSFPGLRVGWVIGPKSVIARLAEFKQASDLHSDQLAQAILLRFAQSGELQRHLMRTCEAGTERLHTVLNACAKFLPPGTSFTKPDGGMSLWIELPAPLTSDGLLSRAEERGVNFLPGRFFSKNHGLRGLRLSFGSLTPPQIAEGIQILGEVAGAELAARGRDTVFAPGVALV
jgi:2-aminoadipate transaminase